MSYSALSWSIAAAAAVMLSGSQAKAEKFHAVLSGFEEVGALPALTSSTGTEPETFRFPTGAILSKATATLDLDLDRISTKVTFKLTYSMNFSSAVQQAHIHFGERHVPGGIMVFFCSNLSTAPAGTQACPASGTVTGTWTPGNVQAIAGQNVMAGDFSALVAALTSDTAYANIHTVNFPAGEIRGQVRRPDDDDRR
jgi:CHRD domain